MKTLVVDGEPTVLQLWDTAGQERSEPAGIPHALFVWGCEFLLFGVDLLVKHSELIPGCPFWSTLSRFGKHENRSQCDACFFIYKALFTVRNFVVRNFSRKYLSVMVYFRFRSVAKSYFRRADGVLLLYDVTCEKSFLNVREWVDMIEVVYPLWNL